MRYLNQIIRGEALDVLKQLPDQSFHTCVTSPPYYGLRDYGVEGQIGLEKNPEQYIERLIAVFREVKRVLRDDGTLWLNMGDSFYPHGGSRGNKTPAGDTLRGRKNAYQPAPKMQTGLGLKSKDLMGMPWRIAFAMQADGWYLRSDIVWHKPNPMPESVKDRPTRAHEYIFLLAKSPRYYFDNEAIKEPLSEASWKRLNQPTFDQQKGGPKDYGNGKNANRSMRKAVENLKKKSSGNLARKYGDERGRPGSYMGGSIPSEGVTRNKRSVWTVSTKPFKGAHFAVFPPDLITPCILAGCPENGVVLDPFIGSGTTAVVAKSSGRNFTGIELNAAYKEIAEGRIWWKP